MEEEENAPRKKEEGEEARKIQIDGKKFQKTLLKACGD
jgi:hypothetical protein